MATHGHISSSEGNIAAFSDEERSLLPPRSRMPKAIRSKGASTIPARPPPPFMPLHLRSITPLELPRAVAERLIYRQGLSGDVGSLMAQMGGEDAVPEVTIGPSDVRTLSIDPRLAFLLSRIDGALTIREVRDLGPLGYDEVVVGLWALVHLGAVRTRTPSRS